MTHAEIAPLIRGILSLSGLTVINGHLIRRALDLYEGKGIDYVNGYLAAVMEKRGINNLHTFDHKYISILKNLKRKKS